MKLISGLMLCVFFAGNLFAQFQNQRSPTDPSSSRPGSQPPVASQRVVKGEYIVKLKSGVSLNGLTSLQVGNLSQVAKVGKSNFVLLKSNLTLEQVKNSFVQNNVDSQIDYIEPNFLYYKQGYQTSKEFSLSEVASLQQKDQDSYIPVDEFFTKLWGLNNEKDNRNSLTRGADIDALEAWKITTGDKKVVIAIIDTGIDYNHPEISSNMWKNSAEANGSAGVDDDNNGIVDDIYGAAFVGGKVSGNPLDDHSHGTHCAGTIAASHNEQGVAGVMANAQLMAVKFLSKTGSGSTADAIKAINYASQMGAQIMSNSWGGGSYSKALEDAIIEANAKGIIFVAAAGNESNNNDANPSYPASYKVDNIIAVAAHDINDKMASFSSYGAKSVHIAAPGVNILSTVLSGKYASYSGTSMATPHISGIVGLMLSQIKTPPNNIATRIANIAVIKEALVKTATAAPAYTGKVVSGGRVSTAKAITYVMNAPRN